MFRAFFLAKMAVFRSGDHHGTMRFLAWRVVLRIDLFAAAIIKSVNACVSWSIELEREIELVSAVCSVKLCQSALLTNHFGECLCWSLLAKLLVRMIGKWSLSHKSECVF